MINKMRKFVIVILSTIVACGVVGCGETKVGGEKLPISGIKEFESYIITGNYSAAKCVGCTKKELYCNTNIGKMCKKCGKRYEKYLNMLQEEIQTCGKCGGYPTIVIEYDRYNNPTEVACDNCAIEYENEMIDEHMKNVMKDADLDRELVNIAKKQARIDAEQAISLTLEEQEMIFNNHCENFANTVIANYVLSSLEQEAMLYVYMNEYIETLN